MSSGLLTDVFIMCLFVFNLTNVCSAQTDLYYVNSSVCKMPAVPPFTKELLTIYKRVLPEKCKTEATLVSATYQHTLERYVLRYNSSKVDCLYQEIVRSGIGAMADKTILIKKSIYLPSPYIVPEDIHAMLVSCYEAENMTNIVQKNAFAFVQAQQQQQLEAQLKTTPKKPSVIMIGIDTLSRTNLRRSMPQLYKYLNDNDWHEMQGYNKVGDNTFPNLLAVLTGHLPKSAAKQYCDYHEVGCLNKLPFVWQDFKQAGYVTAYAEDDTPINTFSNMKPGFLTPPVDYYPLPFFLAIERRLKLRKRFARNYCLGQKLSTSYVLDYCEDFITRFIRQQQPMFGLFWLNEYSSGNVLAASAFDGTIVGHLKKLRKKSLFNESIVIFFSDHGARYGKARTLPEGFINERLPTLFFWLPMWFRHKYTHYVKALKKNRNRLSSNYDLYLTLQHILRLGGAHYQKSLATCPRCQTLFHTLPFNRTCADAGIPQHYCTCDAFVSTNITTVQPVVSLVLKAINDFIAAKHLNDKCSNLTLAEIQEAYRKQTSALEQPVVSVYRIYFTAMPNNMKFEVTVSHNNLTNDIELDVEDISRLNQYSSDARCSHMKEAFKFCVCYNRIHKPKIV